MHHHQKLSLYIQNTIWKLSKKEKTESSEKKRPKLLWKFSKCILLIKSFTFKGTTISVSDFSLPQHTADKIGKLVMDKFTEMIVGQASSHSRRKVLAGIVLSKDGDVMDDMEVISVTTGTKCINGEHMSVNGNSLNGNNHIWTFLRAKRAKQKKKVGIFCTKVKRNMCFPKSPLLGATENQFLYKC